VAAKSSGQRKRAGRLARTIRSLAYIIGLGIALAVYNAVSLRRDVGLAVGPAGSAQEQFFRDSAERPDISTFFKNLKPSQRLQMAKNIGRYSDPELAKLCGKCLDTFDASARAALTDSLAVVGHVNPRAVAALMNLPGSFQQLAIAAALRQSGPDAIPMVAKEFSDADARANAIAYLVAAGAPAIAPTLPYLDASDKDVRLAAADALGKLRARQAVSKLTGMYLASKNEEQLAYLTALAGIGDPSSEAMMTKTLQDESQSPAARAEAALGLGAIGSQSSLAMLWNYAGVPDKSLRASAVSGLQLAGDPALRLVSGNPLSHRAAMGEGAGGSSAEASAKEGEGLLRVAEGIHTPYADDIIRQALLDPSQSRFAAEVAGNRPTLVPNLASQARRLDATRQGDVVDAVLRALATTQAGRAALKEIESTSPSTPLGALASRRLSLVHG